MPFFYSQHLRDDQRPMLEVEATMANANPITGLPRRHSTWHPRSGVRGSPQADAEASGRRGGRLVWHSNVGASGRRHSSAGWYKPLAHVPRRPRAVHFTTVEVREFSFDWSNAGDVFYSRAELTALGQDRFDDAAALRDRREDKRGHGRRPSMDDVDLATKPRDGDVAAQLSLALEGNERDGEASIRGIEHFVYPALQQEMIRRKRELQREVIEFARSGHPDPQGWRLAERSRLLSSWARGVAAEKGIRDAAVDPHRAPGEGESELIQKSRDDLEQEARTIRGSASCVALDEPAACVAAWLSARSHDELDASARPGRTTVMQSWRGCGGGADEGERRAETPPRPPAQASSGLGGGGASGGEGLRGTPPRPSPRLSWKVWSARSPRGKPRGADDDGCSGHVSPGAPSLLSSKSHDELGCGGMPQRSLARALSGCDDGTDMEESPGGTPPRPPARPSWKGWSARSPRGRPCGADEDGCAGRVSLGAPSLLSSKSYDELDQSARPWRGGRGSAGREEAGNGVPHGDGETPAARAASAPNAVPKFPRDVAAECGDDDGSDVGSREVQAPGASTAEK